MRRMSKSSISSNDSIDLIDTPKKNKEEFQNLENDSYKMSKSFENYLP